MKLLFTCEYNKPRLENELVDTCFLDLTRINALLFKYQVIFPTFLLYTHFHVCMFVCRPCWIFLIEF